MRRSTKRSAAPRKAQATPRITAAGLRAPGAGVGAVVGFGVGACVHVWMQSCAVCVPSGSTEQWPTMVSQRYFVGSLQVAMHALGGCVLLGSTSHWPVAALQL